MDRCSLPYPIIPMRMNNYLQYDIPYYKPSAYRRYLEMRHQNCLGLGQQLMESIRREMHNCIRPNQRTNCQHCSRRRYAETEPPPYGRLPRIGIRTLSRTDATEAILRRRLEPQQNVVPIIGRIGRQGKLFFRSNLSILHTFVGIDDTSTALRLIQRGTNINAKNREDNTPLHCAVHACKIESTCMLLCHGADVTAIDQYSCTPLMHALRTKQWEIADVLIDFQDDFSHVNKLNETALDIAIWNESPLVDKLIRHGANVNAIDHLSEHEDIPIIYSLINHNNPELFKCLWNEMNPEVLLDLDLPLLEVFVYYCNFPAAQWLECLYLMLSSRYAEQLVQECNYETNLLFLCNLLTILLMFDELTLNDRVSVIYLFLSLGALVRPADFNFIIPLYRYKTNPVTNFQKMQYFYVSEEVDALIYGATFTMRELEDVVYSPMACAKLGLKKGIDMRYVWYFIENCNEVNCAYTVASILSYYSIPSQIKQKWLRVYMHERGPYNEGVFKVFMKQTPEIPSLLELSRNSSHEYLHQNFKVTQPYQLLDIVKRLKIPKSMEDLILFNTQLH